MDRAVQHLLLVEMVVLVVAVVVIEALQQFLVDLEIHHRLHLPKEIMVAVELEMGIAQVRLVVVAEHLRLVQREFYHLRLLAVTAVLELLHLFLVHL